MKLTEEMKAKISAEIDKRMDGQHNAPNPLPQDYWSKHDCEDYDDGNGICAWCGRSIEREKLETEFTRKQETFTREEIAVAIKSVLASIYEEMKYYPYDVLRAEKELHNDTATVALINVGSRLCIDDLLLDGDGDIIMRPSKNWGEED